MSFAVRTYAFLVPLALVAISPASAACTKGRVSLSLPAQRLDERLQQLAHSTGCPIEIDPSTIGDRRVGPLRGRMTPAAALKSSMRGTGLDAGASPRGQTVDRAAQDEFDQRIDGLLARIADRMRAGIISPETGTRLQRELAAIDDGVAAAVKRRGYLSAPDRVRYVDAINRVDNRIGE